MEHDNTMIPDKLFYKAQEVCQITDTQPYVLRFWESEFPQLASEKNRSGQRVYRKQDIELIQRIKKLLYEEEYTIAGARKAIEDGFLGGASIVDDPPARARTTPARRSATDDLDSPPPIKPQTRSSLFEHEEAHAPIETAPIPAPAAPVIETHRNEDYDNALRTIDDLRRELGVVVEARDRLKERGLRIAERLQAALDA
jgi:DNA-binding transcriptional MerR regulator